MARLIGLLLVCVSACGNISRKSDDAGVVRDDVKLIDASMVVTDAGVDGPGPDALILEPAEAREITSGGARLKGATYTFDVQLGHAIEQKKASRTTYTIQGNTAVKP